MSGSVFEIPTQPENQILQISLAGTVYTLNLYWNRFSSTWIIDLSDANGNLLVGGISMVTGADLLSQFSYLQVGGSIVAQTENDPDATPTYANLGSTGHLYFIPSAA